MKIEKLFIIEVLLLVSAAVNAKYIDGVNWADEVVYHTSKVQSFRDGYCGGPGAVMMDSNTPANTWFVLGPCDADGNGNMYGWDWGNGDYDYVAGWRAGDPANAEQEIIVKFESGIEDVSGDDIVVRLYCGPYSETSVWASQDGNDFTQIGEVIGNYEQIPGEGGYFYDAQFDLDNKFADDVHYIRVFREYTGGSSGMFFDAFSSNYIDLPSDVNQVSEFGWTLAGDTNRDCYVNLADFAKLANQWQKCYDPNVAGFDGSVFDDPNKIPSTCHGVYQAGMCIESDVNYDCNVDIMDVMLLAENYLSCNNPNDSNCIETW